MITYRNYMEQFNKLNLLSRYPEIKDFHNFFVKHTDSGTNWTQYNKGGDTKEFIDMYMEELNERLAASGSSQQSNERVNTSTHTRIVTKHPESSGSSSSKHARRGRKKQQEHGSGHANTVRKGRGGKHSTRKAPKKQKVQVLNLPKAKLVELVDPHLLFIARFLRMNNQTKTRRSLENFFAQINAAADARILRKASQYAKPVLSIQKKLYDYLMTNAQEFSIHIPTVNFNALYRMVAKEQQMPSVRLLKRYHNMAGKSTTVVKVKKLYNEIYKAIKEGGIKKTDRLFKRISKVIRDLESYVSHGDESRKLERLPAELSGVFGYMDGCLCQQEENGLLGVDTELEIDF